MVKRSQAKKRKKVAKLLETKSSPLESGESSAKSNSAADLVENALTLVENGDLAGAKDLCKKVIRICDDATLLNEVGGILAQAGEKSLTQKALRRSITLLPEKGFEKYLTLAQFCTGAESLKFITKGVELLRTEAPEDKRRLSEAYCNVAELYMTDLCQEKNAQSSCECAVKAALEADRTNAGAYIVATSFLISSSKFDEAKKMLLDGKSLWYEKYEDLIYEKVEVPVESKIDSEKRMNACRYAIELEMWDDAIQIARQVSEEEVEDCETRYFLAYGLFRRWKEMVEDTNFTNEEEINDYKRDCFEEANETLRLAEAAVKQREAGAKDILNETKQMLDDLGPPPPEEEDAMNEEDKNEEDWETDDEMNE